jgi:apolipoprotein N-acyltransferase
MSGILLTLAFPPYDLWPLVWVAFVPAVVAQHRIMPRRLSGLAYGVGLGSFYWGYFGFMFADNVWFMQWLPLFVAIVATLASNGDRAFQERTGYRWFVLEGAVVWVGIEAIRGLAPFIGTGGLVAFSLYSQPWLIQPVGIFGIFGLGLLIMLTNYAVALGMLALIDRSQHAGSGHAGSAAPAAVNMRLAASWIGGVLLALACWSGLSILQLGQASVPGTGVRVAAIQPGPADNQEERTRKLIAQTREAASQGAQLVVWPEGALNFDPQLRRADIESLVRETGIYLAVGYALRTAGGLRNEFTLISPEGEFLGVYGKDHPVVWMGESSVTRGTYPTYDTPLGTVGAMICYDLNFTDTARNMAGNGAQIIAVGSNDWSSLGRTQYTNLVMRAVENRVALVKADSMYDSSVIDPTGRIVSLAVSSAPLDTILLATVPLGTADAPLIFLGDWLGWLCIAGIAAFFAFDIASGRRARRSGDPVAGGTLLPKAAETQKV